MMGQPDEKAPKFRGFRIQSIAKLRRKLADEVLASWVGVDLSGDAFSRFLFVLGKHLPGVDEDVLLASLQGLAGRPLTEAAAEGVSWRLAGNLSKLQKGIAVPEWSCQLVPEWAPLRVHHVFPATIRAKSGRLVVGARLKFRVLAGAPAGWLISRFFSKALIAHFRTDFGFSRWDKARSGRALTSKQKQNNLPFLNVMEVGGLFLYGLFDAESCTRGTPMFSRLYVPPSCRKLNRQILRWRKRIGHSCPMRWDVPCWQCPAGRSTCRAACRPVDMVKKPCPSCRQVSMFDPEVNRDFCLSCCARSEQPLPGPSRS